MKRLEELDIIESRRYFRVDKFICIKEQTTNADNTQRLCLDLRELNKIIISQPFKLPNIEDISVKLKNPKYLQLLAQQVLSATFLLMKNLVKSVHLPLH